MLLGCCTNLIDFYERTGVDDKIRWYDSLTFLEPGGRASVIGSSSLPAPLHTMPAFLRAQCWSPSRQVRDCRRHDCFGSDSPSREGRKLLSWLRNHGQTEQAIERFWKPILVSALNEDVDKVSVAYAAQVVRESFLKSPGAGRMGVPSVPLTELYQAAGDYIRARGGEVKLRSTIESFRAEPVAGGNMRKREPDGFRLLDLCPSVRCFKKDSAGHLGIIIHRNMLDQFETSPITGIHLWFDRQITDLEHAVLLDRTIQWMFHKSKLLGRNGNGGGSYIEVVVSSSKDLVEKSKTEIVELTLKELAEFFPEVQQAKLLKSTVIKEVHATYSPRPGVDLNRPRPETVWPRVFLAGDWTATGWPATMEGAVRSGYVAAESLAHVGGQQQSAFLVPDLPPRGFMRIFG